MKTRMIPAKLRQVVFAVIMVVFSCVGAAFFSISSYAESLPDSWDSRSRRLSVPVRDQGTDRSCWALTAVGALQMSMDPEEATVLSADHLIQASAFHMSRSEGGDFLQIMAYLAGWQGPVSEAEDPYGDAFSPEGLSPVIHVQEIRKLSGDPDEIKQAVFEYGAVQASLHMNRKTVRDSSYYSAENFAYYVSEDKGLDHDVLIIGWDDNFPKESFGTDPGMNGAFLCQNTWGEDFGCQGCFYVSYADANLGKMALAYTRLEPTGNYDKLYETDPFGWRGRQGYDDEMCWFANVYEAEDEEVLRAYGFYATGPDTDYELYLVRGYENEDSFAERQLLQSGSLENAGYYTIDLKQPVLMTPGEHFAIIVQIRTPDADTPVAVEYRADEEMPEVQLEDKYGYISQYGEKWEHTETRFGTNVCLKAYVSTLQEE